MHTNVALQYLKKGSKPKMRPNAIALEKQSGQCKEK